MNDGGKSDSDLVVLAVEECAGGRPERVPEPFFEFYRTDFRALRAAGVPVELRRTRDGRWAVTVARSSLPAVARVLGRPASAAEAGDLLAPA